MDEKAVADLEGAGFNTPADAEWILDRAAKDVGNGEAKWGRKKGGCFERVSDIVESRYEGRSLVPGRLGAGGGTEDVGPLKPRAWYDRSLSGIEAGRFDEGRDLSGNLIESRL